MQYCLNCFQRACRCGHQKAEIDYYIYPAIHELNRKGYDTRSCCSGHEDTSHLRTAICFEQELACDIQSEYFEYDSYNYRGFHERRDCIRVKPEVAKEFKKKRTNKLALIQNINKELYAWAKSLPAIRPIKYNKVDFPDTYFEQEVEPTDVLDIQKSWMLFTKASPMCKYTVTGFFEEVDREGTLSEALVNRVGDIEKYHEQDYANFGANSNNAGFMMRKIKFDAAGDYQLLLCGYEPYATIEKLLIGEAVWFLSYARTDLVSEYGDGENHEYLDGLGDMYDLDDDDAVCYDKSTAGAQKNTYTESLFDADDIQDFQEEHPNANELDLFTHLFNRMCRVNINTCVFSADNVNIVFSNKTDFSLLMIRDQNIVAFGKGDYDYLDFTHINVSQKEMHVYANGRLLVRKEIE